MTINPKNFPHIQDLDLPTDHKLYKVVVFDTDKQEYYNKRSDMYLTEDDVKYHSLPHPEELIGYKKCQENKEKNLPKS